MNTNHRSCTRWIAGFVMAAGLGTAIVAGGPVASADTGTTTNTNISSHESAPGTSAGSSDNGTTQMPKKMHHMLMQIISNLR
jgi:hypothetical protein